MKPGHAYDQFCFAAERGLMRESYRELVGYLPPGKVLDLACGQGHFLGLLAETGQEAVGVDHDICVVNECSGLGSEVHCSDIFEFLLKSREKWNGIILAHAHIVEHFFGDELNRLLTLAWQALAEGGVAVVVTPNMLNPGVARRGFWLDMDHKRPYPPELLAAAFQGLGGTVLAQGDTAVEKIRFRNRWCEKGAVKTIASFLYGFWRAGFSFDFLLGDAYVIAKK